jgi:hypothetical protein
MCHAFVVLGDSSYLSCSAVKVYLEMYSYLELADLSSKCIQKQDKYVQKKKDVYKRVIILRKLVIKLPLIVYLPSYHHFLLIMMVF